MKRPVFTGSFALPGELVVDSFAGGGGASTGIEDALNRPVDIAINHDAEAIAMHRANHPETKHFCEDIFEVDPVAACAGRPVGLAWFSPDCTHFSKAKGTTPVKKEIRGLAWVVINWARSVKPRVIVLENVEEFQTWGPLLGDRPDPSRSGETFREWLAALRACGYEIEFKTMVAADYGAPTTRKRLFLVARRDGSPIVWPAATHGKGRPAAWRSAAEIIDWSLPCPSIFERKRPLVEATMRRIARGIRRFVIESGNPFIVPVTHPGDERVHGIGEPLGTVTGTDHNALAAAFLTKYWGSCEDGQPVTEPMPTITAGGNRGGGHVAEVRAFLLKYYGSDGPRFGLVMVAGEAYEIVDIGMRMIQPPELFAAQGFPDWYDIAPEFNGKPMTKSAQTSCVGNSVSPPPARELVAANVRAA